MGRPLKATQLTVRPDMMTGVYNIYVRGKVRWRVDTLDNYKTTLLVHGQRSYWRDTTAHSIGAQLARHLVAQYLGVL